ncbi:MAG: hypothetical protein U1E51_31225 [Candidatus Binatia bacterium]|nr:hypothetical protein [Candidatus Binatia bacterium]
MSDLCPHCNADAGFDQIERGPHVGLYCRACGRWIRWIPRGESQARPVESTAPKDSSCGHCPELDRLATVMQGVERELIIIVRTLCNGANK